MYWVRADSSSEPQRLTEGKTRQVPHSLPPDGNRLAYNQPRADWHFEMTVPIEGDSDHPPLERQGHSSGHHFSRGTRHSHPMAIAWRTPRMRPERRRGSYGRGRAQGGGARPAAAGSASGRWVPSRPRASYPSLLGMSVSWWPLHSEQRFLCARVAPSVVPKELGGWGITGRRFDLAADRRRFAVVLFPGATAEGQKPPTALRSC
jgi:hypothetical protein